MKLVFIFSVIITSTFAQTRQQIINEANSIIDNAGYSNADNRTLNRVLSMLERANLLLEDNSTPPNEGRTCEISGGNSWVYIDIDGVRAHSIYNNANQVLSTIQSSNCKRNSLDVTISSSNSWSYIRVNNVNIFSFYNNGDLLMSALESVQQVDAFRIQIKDVTLTSSNSWVYIRISGSIIYSFYNNTDLAILKIEQYPLLKDLISRARNKCKITQTNGWSYLHFNQSKLYSFYNNWNQADQKLNRLTRLGICIR